MKKILLLVALLAAAPAVFAQDYYGVPDYGLSKNTTRVEFYGGMVLPQKNWKYNGEKVGNTGWTAGIGFQRNVWSFLSLGMDGNYTQFGDGDKAPDGTFLRTGVATGLVPARLNLFPSQATRFYIPAGIGVGHSFAREKHTDGSHVTHDGTALAMMLGLGMEFDIDESFIFGVEGRYYLVNTADSMKDDLGKKRFHFTNIMLKLGYRF